MLEGLVVLGAGIGELHIKVKKVQWLEKRWMVWCLKVLWLGVVYGISLISLDLLQQIVDSFMIFIAQQSDINSNTERITLPLSGFYDTDFSLKASVALDVDSMDMEIDLSNLGTVKTIFLALFSKLDVPIKTTISANVLEEALNGTVTVEKQCAHFFGVTINEEQAESGIVIIVTSTAQSKFKLLYFEQDANGGYGLALQEDSEKTGKVTSIGMYFLHFQVHKMDSTMNVLAMAKDPERAFFKRLEGLQPCEVSELKPGTHIFAIYGDNFFKTASYTIEVVCEKSYEDTTQKLKHSEAQILRKRNELRQFEAEYRKLTICFTQSWLMVYLEILTVFCILMIFRHWLTTRK
ncbi:chaperone protein dnaJ 15-like [Arachis hypogaea]|uniref:chaperone protein dnaJ 15-like n=1 Tax=Arachis hypogaea TaxID=3818 RepID=UPI003B21E989